MSQRHVISIDPASGDEVGRVEVVGARGVADAVAEARAAQPAWAATPVTKRVDVLRQFTHVVLADLDASAEAITREAGKPVAESLLADLLPTLDQARFLATDAPRLLAPRRRRFRNPLLLQHGSTVEHRPVGVVGAITPWNYPLAIPAASVLPALVAGNAVVLKPSEETPLVADRLAAWLRDAGLPDGLLQVVHGAGETGGALAAADVDALLFTGSVPTGRRIAEVAARRFIPCCLELGGKDPAIVLPGADRARATRGVLWGAMTNAGQTCASIERCYVPRHDGPALVAGLAAGADGLRLGHGLEAGVDMGPVINDAAAKRIMTHIRDAEKAGATVVAGGAVRDDLGPRFIAPTVLQDVSADMTCMQEETFGPTLPVAVYDDVSDAVTAANDSDFGLTASVWGDERAATAAVADQLQAGTITINDHIFTYGATETPWGGVKASGVGATHGAAALHDVTRLRHTATAPRRGRDAWWYPYDRDLSRILDVGLPWLYGRRGPSGARLLRPLLRRRR